MPMHPCVLLLKACGRVVQMSRVALDHACNVLVQPMLEEECMLYLQMAA